MPYEWTPPPSPNQAHWQLDLWPYRSLLRKDFVLFFGATIALVGMPLIALVGSAALWVILPFIGLMIAALWYAVHVSYRRGEILEECIATPDKITLTRHNPKGDRQVWEANRFWATLHLHPKGGPVDNYLTLRGGDREVEIGSFLDADERLALYDELRRALRFSPTGF